MVQVTVLDPCESTECSVHGIKEKTGLSTIINTILLKRAIHPTVNGYVESFNSKFIDELLNRELLVSFNELRYVVDRWRMDYNHYQPLSTLDNMAPAAFAATCLEQGETNTMKRRISTHTFTAVILILNAGVSLVMAEDLSNSEERSPFLISDGSRFVPKDFYPKFSWEVTPQYFMFGDTQRVLHPEEVRSIAARTDFLCIEKSHGLKMLGAAELGARHEATAFKKIKADMKVLFYFNSAYAWPFTSYNKGYTRDQINQHPELKKLLLVDAKTGELAHRRNVFFFDVLNPELREWWVNTVAKGVAESGCDGAFIDQMHGFAWLRKERSQEVQRAMGEMMASLKRKLGPDKILLGNNANQAIAKCVFPAIDASMFEHYNEKLLSKESLLQDWEDMLRIAQAGKMSIFRIGVESDRSLSQQQDPQGARRGRSERMAALARQRLEYYLACYLIGAQPYSYFQYGWGWTLSSGSLRDYPELHKPLGTPKGAYTRVSPDGWEFTREFEHASVWVDTDKGQGRITWR